MISIPWWSTHLGEEEAEAAAGAIRNRHISRGPLTAELERRIAGELDVPGAICVPSGSMGLFLALMALGVGPGDEVIVPAVTWIATAHAARLLGARVVPVDCIESRPLLDPACVERAITPRTKVILPVHLTGRAAPLDPIFEIAKRHGIDVVEDAAQAFGSRSSRGFLGTHGRVGVYSLGLAKLISTGQGGVVVTRDLELLERMRRCTVHGVEHDAQGEIYGHLGFNMKFTDILAAVGLAQLDKLEAKAAHVRSVYQAYRTDLADLPGLEVEAFDLAAGELPLWTEIRTGRRDELERHLADAGIETHRLHRPLHHAPHLSGGAPPESGFPHSERHVNEILILPSGPAQDLANVHTVAATVRAVLDTRGPHARELPASTVA